MINNKKLYIDEYCPLCKGYANLFIKTRFIDSSVLDYYQKMENKVADKIDLNLAKSEVALFDLQSQKTLYGIDAILQILKEKIPFINRVGNIPIFYTLLNLVYQTISYSRRVFLPRKSGACLRSCDPPVHYGYRWAYILSVALITGFILNQFTHLLFQSYDLTWHPMREYAICFGQILWQALFLRALNQNKVLDYLGNMSTVSLAGGILLIPMILFSKIISIPPLTPFIYFAMVVGLMLMEHIRRCKLLALPYTTSISWVIYRLFVLILFLKLAS